MSKDPDVLPQRGRSEQVRIDVSDALLCEVSLLDEIEKLGGLYGREAIEVLHEAEDVAVWSDVSQGELRDDHVVSTHTSVKQKLFQMWRALAQVFDPGRSVN